MKALNKIFSYWRDDLFGKKSVEKEYPYNIEFGNGRTKVEMDKMQDELMQALKEDCECLPDCGCKEKWK